MHFAKTFRSQFVTAILLLMSQMLLAEEVVKKEGPQWIWTPVQTPGEVPNGACFFRRDFKLDAPSKATLQIAADDHFEVYLNGKLVGQGQGWQHLTKFDLSEYIVAGKNALSVKVVNRKPGHAGLVGQIHVKNGDERIVTDTQWKSSTKPIRSWKQPRFAAQAWKPAKQLGAWNQTAPWIPRLPKSARRVAQTESEKPARVETGEESNVVLTAGEEDVAKRVKPKLLKPLEETLPWMKKKNSPGGKGNMIPRFGRGKQIRNPFVKQKDPVAPPKTIETPTDVPAPPPIEESVQLPSPEDTLLQSPVVVEPAKEDLTVPEMSVDVPEAPGAPLSRFSPATGFSVEEVVSGADTGSLIASTFNEFGQMLLAQENGPLLICMDTDKDGKLDDVRPYCEIVKNCQGILALSGMTFVVAEGPEGHGLYRLSDEARKGKLDTATLLAGFDVTSNEHGPHGITLGPDGKLYVAVGNHATLKRKFSKLSPRQNLYEGDLVPRYEDPGGHANGVRLPAGFVLRTDINGKKLELFASGLRNVYDLAFNADGELFAHDSDMESDMTTNWYRPTRIYHVPPGGEFGWRSGWAKWPSYYLDVVPPAAETGRGSPTGAVVYNHYIYPESFRGVMFLGDWTEGKILVAKPVADGAGYKMETDTFLEGRPMNVTDLDVGPDGMLYFTTGGRATEGGVYRVVWNGAENGIPKVTGIQQALVSPQINSSWGRQRVAAIQQRMGQASWNAELVASAKNYNLPAEQRIQALQLMQWVGPIPKAKLLLDLSQDEEPSVRKTAAYLMSSAASDDRIPLRLVELMSDDSAVVRRQACESLVRAHRSVPFEYVMPLLASRDRTEAWAARSLLQLDHPDEWEQEAFATDDVNVFIQSATALMTAWPSKDGALAVVSKSLKLMQGYMDDEQFIDTLRLLQLSVLRGKLSPDDVPELKAALAEEFPANHHIMNREMIRLLVRLQVTSIKSRYLAYLESDLPEGERIHLATHLRFLNADWMTDEKFKISAHLKPSADAGNSVGEYLQSVARDFSKGWKPEEDQLVIERGDAAPSAALEAILRLPNDLSIEQIEELVRLDQSVEATDGTSKKLKVAILAVLARDGQDLAMAHIRDVYDQEPQRRIECVIGMAEQPAGDNWPYLVDSLKLVDGEIAHEVIKKLHTVNRSPKDSEPYRQVIMAGLRLGDDGGSDAVRLLERWRGFASSKDTPPWKDALLAWQNWFTQTYPSEPAPQIAHSKKHQRWDYEKLVAHLGNSTTLKKASPERGSHVFVQAQCSNCHQHGNVGESMGPNLSSVGSRFLTKEIVESIMYPSRVISDQYKAKTLITDEGMSYTGIVGSGGIDELMVLQADGKKVRLPSESVEQTVPSKLSAMPEGLLDGLSLQEITDLVAFLSNTPDTRMADNPDNDSESR